MSGPPPGPNPPPAPAELSPEAARAEALVRRRLGPERPWKTWVALVAVVLTLAWSTWQYARHLTACLQIGWSHVGWDPLENFWRGGTTHVFLQNEYAFETLHDTPHLDALVGLRNLVELDLTNAYLVDDSKLAFLNRLVRLRVLRVGSNDNSPEAPKLPRTDAVLDQVVALPDLEELDLSRSQVTDAGIRKLATLKRLRVLGLNGTDITDSSLDILATLPVLEVLDLEETKVTPQAIDALARRRPELTIFHPHRSSPDTQSAGSASP